MVTATAICTGEALAVSLCFYFPLLPRLFGNLKCARSRSSYILAACHAARISFAMVT